MPCIDCKPAASRASVTRVMDVESRDKRSSRLGTSPQSRLNPPENLRAIHRHAMQPERQLERTQFLNLAAVFEGSLVVVAVILGWMTNVDPFARLTFHESDLWWGLVATLPMLVLLAVSFCWPPPPLRTIRNYLVDTLGPLLSQCRWFDLILLAMLAGLTEEILFRGVVQVWLTISVTPLAPHISPLVVGILLSNVLFGLAHLITPTYGLMAMAMGVYLAYVQQTAPHQSLIAPIVTHAAYDWIAFLVVVHAYRRSSDGSADDSAD